MACVRPAARTFGPAGAPMAPCDDWYLDAASALQVKPKCCSAGNRCCPLGAFTPEVEAQSYQYSNEGAAAQFGLVDEYAVGLAHLTGREDRYHDRSQRD